MGMGMHTNLTFRKKCVKWEIKTKTEQGDQKTGGKKEAQIRFRSAAAVHLLPMVLSFILGWKRRISAAACMDSTI